MPVSICPRCKHINPEYAVYCHFDGVVLQAQQDAPSLRLPSEYVFPSGRRCRTFDEFAQGCQEEWASARDLLMRGIFAQYFRAANRADLVRAANDAKAMPNPDMGLTTFLNTLPGIRTQTPKLDLTPRRILLGAVLVGETKTAPLTLSNQGQGILQGTVSVAEGQDWLSLSASGPVHELDIVTPREQTITLMANPKGLASGQTYGAKLTVVTNGGVVEVPLRMDLVAQPFTKAPFQGVRSQREFAEKVRLQPKAAVPILESGEVQRWYAINGWTYPVSGRPVKGVGGVQQFFEGMGVSKPPTVQLSRSEFRATCQHREVVKGEVMLATDVKKWVYAHITSDSPWLKIAQEEVSGPQQVAVPFEIDTNLWDRGPVGEARLTFAANGGQTLTLRVIVEVKGLAAPARPAAPPAASTQPIPTATSAPPVAPVAPGPPPVAPRPSPAPVEAPIESDGRLKYVPALVTTVVLCLMLRIAMVPLADVLARWSAAEDAATKLNVAPTEESDFARFGGWLRLPWLPILGGSDAKLSAKVFQPGSATELSMSEFRHYFVTYFIRWLVVRTWWLGAIVGVIMVVRRGGITDLPWGIVAGAIAGFGVSATVAAFFLLVELVPHTLWHVAIGAQGGFGYLLLWSFLAIVCWLFVGVALGAVVPLIAPLRRLLIDPFQSTTATLFRIAGLRTLADYWSPRVS